MSGFADRPLALLVLVLPISALACSKVPNPYYVDELGGTASESGSESETAESSASESSSTTVETETETDASESDTDDASSSDTDCPPSESGCPCVDGTMCFPGLTCFDGVCLAPEDCAPPSDAAVLWSYPVEGQPPVDTSCTVSATAQDGGVVLNVFGCADLVTTLSITLAPLPPALAGVLTGETSGAVRVHVEQSSRFVRLAMPNWGLWLVDASLVASGNVAVSDYPGEVLALVGQCPSEPQFCGQEVGAVQRRGVRVLGVPVFDANTALVDPSLYAWVDDAVVDCGWPYYRFALVDWP